MDLGKPKPQDLLAQQLREAGILFQREYVFAPVVDGKPVRGEALPRRNSVIGSQISRRH